MLVTGLWSGVVANDDDDGDNSNSNINAIVYATRLSKPFGAGIPSSDLLHY